MALPGSDRILGQPQGLLFVHSGQQVGRCSGTQPQCLFGQWLTRTLADASSYVCWCTFSRGNFVGSLEISVAP